MKYDVFFRALRTEDAEFINSLRRFEDRENKLGGVKYFVSLERDIKWVQELIMDDKTALYIAVCRNGSDEIIGYTSVSNIDYRNGTCFWSGIKLSPDVTGQGFGFQVTILILKYVFEELRMVRCIGYGLEEHEVAIKLMIKAGFQKEGLMRKFVFKNGEHKNTWLMSILKEEFDVLKEKYEI